MQRDQDHLSQKGKLISNLVTNIAKVKTEHIMAISKSEEIIVSMSENQVQQNYSNKLVMFSNLSFLNFLKTFFLLSLEIGTFTTEIVHSPLL